MSGRTRHWRDGMLITNRKTDRRQGERVRSENIPDWVLRLQLPDELAFSVATGRTSVAGVTVVLPGPTVEARGRAEWWVLQQMQEFLNRIGRGLIERVDAVLARDAYPGLTDGAPWRPAVKRVVRIEVKS